MQLVQHERISQLGRLGELIALDLLRKNGFLKVEDLNDQSRNHVFADIIATRGGTKYLIGVKTRNEMRQGKVGLNESYNVLLVPPSVNRALKEQGKSTEEISSMAWGHIDRIAERYEAVPAWLAIAVRAETSRYSAYFGLASDLDGKRSVPMTLTARARHECLGEDLYDERITRNLMNG